MATFTNQATLSYNNTVTRSNIVTGELVDILAVAKTAVTDTYGCDTCVTYTVSIVNSGAAAFAGLTVTDDLGAYAFGEGTVTPLEYRAGSLKYYVNGLLQTTPTVTAGPPMTVTGISMPAGGNALLVYQVHTNDYAPRAVEDSIVNRATVTGEGLPAAVTAAATINAASEPCLSISKALTPASVPQNGQLTYTFLIENYGNEAAEETDAAIVTDVFNPILQNLSVTFNGTAWTAGTDYTYDATTGRFATVAGKVTVPAATYTQDAATGVWTTAPGSSTLTVTGTL